MANLHPEHERLWRFVAQVISDDHWMDARVMFGGCIGQPREHCEEGRGEESGVVAHTNDRRRPGTMFSRSSPFSFMFASMLPLMMAPLDVQLR